MRFEAGHRYFKKMYKITTSARNICFTLMSRYTLHKYVGMLKSNIVYPIPGVISKCSHNYLSKSVVQQVSAVLNTDPMHFVYSNVMQTNSLTFMCHSYKKLDIELITVDGNNFYFKIESIICVEQHWFLIGSLFTFDFDCMSLCFTLLERKKIDYVSVVPHKKLYQCFLIQDKFCYVCQHVDVD